MKRRNIIMLDEQTVNMVVGYIEARRQVRFSDSPDAHKHPQTLLTSLANHIRVLCLKGLQSTDENLMVVNTVVSPLAVVVNNRYIDALSLTKDIIISYEATYYADVPNTN